MHAVELRFHLVAVEEGDAVLVLLDPLRVFGAPISVPTIVARCTGRFDILVLVMSFTVMSVKRSASVVAQSSANQG